MDKEQLKEYYYLKKEWVDLKQRIDELDAAIYTLRTQCLDGMPHSGGGKGCALEAKLDRKEKLLNLYEAKAVELDKALLTIETAINNLEPRERLLIRLHYIDGMTWEQVAVRLDYSWRQVHRFHSDILEKLRYKEG